MKRLSILLLFLLLTTTWLQSQVLEQDSLALVAFYNSTGGPDWNNNTGWLTGSVSTWYGVTVEGNRVIEIKFYSNNNINGSIPTEIEDLSELGVFVIGNNPGLTGDLPNSIGQLINLQWLGIGNCSLTGTIPNSIGNLINLLFLNFSDNNLIGNIPKEIGYLYNLQFLILFGNQITGSIPAELGNFNNLQELRLNRNNLTGKLPVSLGNILDNWYQTGYVFFDVSENQLTDSIPFSWAEIEIFNGELNFSWNNFTDIPAWNGNWMLNSLGIRDNKMTFEDIEPHFVGYTLFDYAPQQLMGNEIDTLLPLGSTLKIYSGTEGEFTSYEWIHNNQVILYGQEYDTLILENITYADTGMYFCYATNSLATQLLLKRRNVIIGIDTSVNVLPLPRENNISITPNPSDGNFTIHLPGSQKVHSGTIYSIDNKIVYSQKELTIMQHEIHINLCHLTPGIYILKLQLSNPISFYTKKLMINNWDTSK